MNRRKQYRPIIAKVIQDAGTGDAMKLAYALFNAFPHGPREGGMYKAWCEEADSQLGKVPDKAEPKRKTRKQSGGQAELFT